MPPQRVPLFSISDSSALLAVDSPKQHQCFELRLSDGNRIAFSLDDSHPTERSQHVRAALEREFAARSHVEPVRPTAAWNDHNAAVSAFLRGVRVGEDMSSARVPLRRFSVEREPFTSAPGPDPLTEAILSNTAYRRVLYTPDVGAYQDVAMSVDYWIPPEVHDDVDQYFLVKSGEGVLIRDRQVFPLRPLSAVTVDRGQLHEVRVTPGKGPLKLLAKYTPKHHPAGRVDQMNSDLVDYIASLRG